MRRLPLLIGTWLSLLAGSLLAQEAAPAPSPGDPPARVARISDVAGTVSFQPSGDTTWSLATLNYPVTTGDRLYSDRGARAELQVGQLTLRLWEATDLTVVSLTDQLTQIGLTQGTLRVSVYDMAPADSIEIDTPRGAITLLATGEYRVDAPANDSALVVAVYRGTAQWTAGGVAQTVQSGQAIGVSGTGLLQIASVALPPPDSFDQWSADRDRQLASSTSAQYVGRDTPGYADLDAAGVWQTDAEFGPVWYPADVPTDWVPYRHGRWVWVEPWGWSWVEHEPWGYAPFHYGRWAMVGPRWAWLPGSMVARPCYAPALVVFVDGSAFQAGAQAWFPLGPGEPYRPWYHGGGEYRQRMNGPTFGRVPNIAPTPDVNAIQYRNRRLAMTVVPTTTFRSGLAISHRVIPVTQQQTAAAPIAAHPFALPGASAAAGGSLAPVSPRVRRPIFVAAPAPRPAPTVQAHEPLIVRSSVSVARIPRSEPVVVTSSNLPAPPPTQVLIARHAPPPPEPTFSVRQQAMQPDPGRPLEPQQIDNLRARRPAGPARDPENPPHPAVSPVFAAPAPRPSPAVAPAPRPAPAAAPRPQPAAAPRPTPQPSKRPGR